MEEFEGRKKEMLIESYIYAKGQKNLRGGGGEC